MCHVKLQITSEYFAYGTLKQNLEHQVYLTLTNYEGGEGDEDEQKLEHFGNCLLSVQR